MPARHRSRQSALQVLYQWDMQRSSPAQAIANFYDTLHSEEDSPTPAEPDPFLEELVRGTVEHCASIDQRIAAKASNWRLDRMPAVDRNVLRLAVYEMTFSQTPPAVVIDEALDLARQFAGEESVAFVNGVLDAVRKDLPA